MAVQCEGCILLEPNHASFKESKSKRNVFKVEDEFRQYDYNKMPMVNQMEWNHFRLDDPAGLYHTNQ